MLIDLRHHIITLAAVFLALAVGMAVGGSYISGSSVERRLGRQLEVEFAKVKTTNDKQQAEISRLKELLRKNEEFGHSAASILVDGKLAGWRFAVIQTGDYSEATQNLKAIVEESGAKIVSLTTLSSLEDDEDQERARRAVELITGETEGVYDPVGEVLGILADAIATGSNPEAVKMLEDKGLLSTSGEYYWHPSAVVIVGGGKKPDAKRAERIDLALLDRLKSAGAAQIAAVEPSYAAISYIPVYHRKSISTVDNIDQAMGQVALVFALAGEPGNYGTKKSADRVAPERLGSRSWRGHR